MASSLSLNRVQTVKIERGLRMRDSCEVGQELSDVWSVIHVPKPESGRGM